MVFIINGFPMSGKTTFEEKVKILAAERGYSVFITSIIDPIKALAKEMGWNGDKTEKNRVYLHQLKNIADGLGNYSYNKTSLTISSNAADIIFVDCREKKDIDKFIAEHNAITVLIKREKSLKNVNNAADQDVENFTYDYVIEIPEGIENVDVAAQKFLEEWGMI